MKGAIVILVFSALVCGVLTNRPESDGGVAPRVDFGDPGGPGGPGGPGTTLPPGASTTTTPAPFSCAREGAGLHVYPGNTQYYYKCVYDNVNSYWLTTIHACPGTLRFNAATKQCT